MPIPCSCLKLQLCTNSKPLSTRSNSKFVWHTVRVDTSSHSLHWWRCEPSSRSCDQVTSVGRAPLWARNAHYHLTDCQWLAARESNLTPQSPCTANLPLLSYVIQHTCIYIVYILHMHMPWCNCWVCEWECVNVWVCCMYMYVHVWVCRVRVCECVSLLYVWVWVWVWVYIYVG